MPISEIAPCIHHTHYAAINRRMHCAKNVVIGFLAFAVAFNAFAAWMQPSPYVRTSTADALNMKLGDRMTAIENTQRVFDSDITAQLKDIQQHLLSHDDDLATLMSPAPRHHKR